MDKFEFDHKPTEKMVRSYHFGLADTATAVELALCGLIIAACDWWPEVLPGLKFAIMWLMGSAVANWLTFRVRHGRAIRSLRGE
jgi:hypothetical protein